MGAHVRRSAQGLSEPPEPVFVVHSLAHAVAALKVAAAANRHTTLLSAVDAGIYAGAGWFRALVDAARAAAPDSGYVAVLDCGDDAGAAQAAIRAGIDAVVYSGRADVAERLTAIAADSGVRLLTRRPAALLDLAQWFFAGEETLRRHCAEAIGAMPPTGEPG